MSKTKQAPSACKICGVSTMHVYFGVSSCESCKMFFKRNAENKTRILKCLFENQCEVNICTRHICAACRLAKCFRVGMSVELIRGAQVTKRKKRVTSSALVPVTRQRYEYPQKLTTLNLLGRDHSSLTGDQWILLSNLIHTYDENNALIYAKDCMGYINSQHPKLRFKLDPAKVVQIATVFYKTAENFICSNQHFSSLSNDDRSTVLRGALDNVSCLGSGLVLRQSGLIESPAFRNGLEITYGPVPYQSTLKLIEKLDANVDIIKLTISIFAFCTSNCAVFNENASLTHLSDIKSFMKIQNMYAEAVWKYMLYKYTFQESVVRFTQLVQTVVMGITVRTHLQSVKNHTDVIETLIQQIEGDQLSICLD